MTGSQAVQISFDESMHLNLGDMINQVIQENPELWNEGERNGGEQFSGDRTEIQYAEIDASRRSRYECKVRKRFEVYWGCRSYEPFPLDVKLSICVKKELFETRVTEYQVGGALQWD